MFEKRYRITLLFNANKVYDRQVVEGVGEYLQASQSDWDIFIEEDFRCRIDNIKDWLGDGVIADFDDREIETLLEGLNVPIVGVGGSYHQEEDYPPVHYIATDNYALVEAAFMHLKEKGINRFAFYGLPDAGESAGRRNASTRSENWCLLNSIRVWSIRDGDSTGKLATRSEPAGGLDPDTAAANWHYCGYRRPRTSSVAGVRASEYSCTRKA